MTIKINRRVRLALRMPQTKEKRYLRRIRTYRLKMESIRQKYGYFIQGITDGPKSFTYTSGRLRSNQSEIIVPSVDTSLAGNLINNLIRRMPAIFEVGNLYQEIALDFMTCTKTGEPTKIMVVYASPADIKTKMLFSQNEYRLYFAKNATEGTAVEDVTFPAPLKILVAGEDNRLPPSHRGSELVQKQHNKDLAGLPMVQDTIRRMVKEMLKNGTLGVVYPKTGVDIGDSMS